MILWATYPPYYDDDEEKYRYSDWYLRFRKPSGYPGTSRPIQAKEIILTDMESLEEILEDKSIQVVLYFSEDREFMSIKNRKDLNRSLTITGPKDRFFILQVKS